MIERSNLDLLEAASWLPSHQKPLVISGPCGAETETQLIETARLLGDCAVDILRAGIWKPRTRPDAFEGAGEVALQWLQNVKQETSLPVTIEVASSKHVELALQYGIDYLWIGARSTTSPFAVQEIAEALKGIDIPVFVKNPVNPDIGLWIGALERLNRVGISKLAAIHRGFSVYEKTMYRNNPTWQIPIELKLLFPELPIICDPSHIGGTRELIHPLAQKALDLNFDGLMIEAHIDPCHAWSDAQQQITPRRLKEILDSLIVRKTFSEDIDFQSHLEELRSEIDLLDRNILQNMDKRMALVRKIGQFKLEHNVTILQGNRWEEILSNVMARAMQLDMGTDFVVQLYKSIHDESIRNQNLIMNEEKNTHSA